MVSVPVPFNLKEQLQIDRDYQLSVVVQDQVSWHVDAFNRFPLVAFLLVRTSSPTKAGACSKVSVASILRHFHSPPTPKFYETQVSRSSGCIHVARSPVHAAYTSVLHPISDSAAKHSHKVSYHGKTSRPSYVREPYPGHGDVAQTGGNIFPLLHSDQADSQIQGI